MTTLLCIAAVSAEIIWTKPICVETNRYIGWPTVCCRANGELLAVFSGDRNWHVCPYGKVQLVRSKDGGETWSDPVTIRSTCLDDRDSGIIELKDGGNPGDMGYPSTVQLKDGTLVTVYYQVAKPYKTPCLMATKWRLGAKK